MLVPAQASSVRTESHGNNIPLPDVPAFLTSGKAEPFSKMLASYSRLVSLLSLQYSCALRDLPVVT